MTQPSDQPIGIPGSQPRGPSLTKPVFQSPVPPPPPFGDQTPMVLAGWGLRFGAVVIDACAKLVLSLVISLIGFLLFADQPFGTEYTDPDGISNLGGIFLVAFVIYYVVPLFYAPPFMAAWNGATPGKRAVGIRVVTELGVAPSFGEAVLRESIFKTVVISWVGGLFFLPVLLNYLWPLWDDQSRAGHDFMARTRVVKA